MFFPQDAKAGRNLVNQIKKTDPDLLSRMQIKALTQQARSLVQEAGHPVTPFSLFLAFLALMAQTGPASAEGIYWAYVPDPPLLHPLGWGIRNVPVYNNDTQVLGSPSDNHITKAETFFFNYTGLSFTVPICLTFAENITGCLTLDKHTMVRGGYDKDADMLGAA